MSPLNVKTVAKRVSLLALSGVFVVGIAACGGGGGSSTSSDFGGSGSAIKGPLDGATVSVTDVDGNAVTVSSGSKTNADGTYSASLSGISATSFPIIWKFSGGTDTVTGAAPTMDVETIASDSTVTTVNALPQTTMLVAAAKAKAGGGKISAANVTEATAAISSSFGMGIDLASILTGSAATITAQKDAIVQAAEATSEVVRRMTASLSGSASVTTSDMGKVLAAMAQEAAGTAVDAVTLGGSAVNANTFKAQLLVKKAEVQYEVVQGVLEVGNTTGATVALSSKLASVPTLSTAFLSEAATNAGAAAEALTLLGVANTDPIYKAYTAFQSTVGAAVTSGNVSTLKTDINNSVGTALGLACAPNCSAEAVAQKAATEQSAADTKAKNTTTISDAALKAAADKLKFQVLDSSIKIMDGMTTINPSATPAVTSGVLSANFTTALSASNLSQVIAGTGGTAPSLMFSVSNVPGGSGTAAVTMLLKDGSSETHSTGQRQLSVTFNVNWSSNGTKLTVTTPSTGMATASYYTATATTPATATLNNSVMDSVMISSGGVTTQASLDIKIANLFKTSTLATPLNAVQVAGSYFYKITMTGLPLALTTGSVVTDMSSAQGTFSVQ